MPVHIFGGEENMRRAGKTAALALCAAFLGLAGVHYGMKPGLPAARPADGTGPARPAPDLSGLWHAKLRFGPDVRGPLTIALAGASGNGVAEIAGRTAAVRSEEDSVVFDLPNAEGSFKGRLAAGRIIGHWIQPRTVSGGFGYASPVTLRKIGPRRWRGLVDPLADAMTFFLSVTRKADGTFGAFLQNPERNAGIQFGLEQIVLEGTKVKLLGRRSPDAAAGVVLEGAWDAENGTISLPVPWRGGTFCFKRATPAEEALFYPRGRTPAPYVYHPPADEGDGWPVASVESVGLSREKIERFVDVLLATPIDSVHAPQIHGLLIARHGRLVLEEYFHGFHRLELHDTRSAAKSLTSVLTGAAMLRGFPLSVTTPVYGTMMGPPPADLDPRKAAITVENLLTMSSGLDCDDSDPNSAGREDAMQEQTGQPDWFRFTLELKMTRRPGEKAVYGSANPHLLGGVLARKTGLWLPDLFRDLLAEPLGLEHYAMNLTPTGTAYMGGGLRVRPREFMKAGQMMLDGGRWRGRQVVSPEWARRAVSPLYEMSGGHYGYLWWVTEYPHRGRTVRAFYAGGNGGQVVMGFPDLGLVIAFYGGNYSDRTTYVSQRVYIPQYILPAIE
jgi:CubicO group peptidase (beta-lactamase class C family)